MLRVIISGLILFLSSSLFSQPNVVLTNVAPLSTLSEQTSELKTAKDKKYQGLLWEITGNGLKKPSYIYGTMHVSKKLAFRLSDTFYLALKNADMVALELNPDTWMEDMIKSGSYQNRNRFQSGGDFYNSFALGAPNQKMLQRLLSRSHSFVNYMLYRKNASDDNFEENTFLDLFIFQSGKKMKKLVTGLENYMQVQELSAKATMPVDKSKEEKEKKNKKNTYVERKKDGRITLEDAYRKGDLDALDSMTRANEEADNYVHFMINERNRLMVERMDSLMKFHSLFTGVGAAHLPGNKGMINMLREKGYSVRPVNSKSGRTAEKMKEKIEQTVVPLAYSMRFSPDSVFSVELPGPLYESYDDDGFSEFFYPEMANGAYYNIYRLNTYAPITGIKEDSVLAVLDNILYEAIPGKIIRKTFFVQQNYKGLDITNLTRRGDYQRYRIFVTPMEIVIFKMSGIDKFVLTNGDRYFNSIKFRENGTNPYLRKHDISVYMPGLRDENFSTPFPESKNTFQAQSYYNSAYYLFMEADLHDFSYIEEDTFELDMLAYKFYDDLKFQPEWKKYYTHQGMPAIMYKLIPAKKEDEDKEESYDNRLSSSTPVPAMYISVLLKGPRYFIMATTEKDSLKYITFFNSFKINTPQLNTKNLISFSDTTLHYTIKTPVLPNDYSNFGYLYSYYKSADDKEKYEAVDDFREFSLPLQHEYVYLDYLKLNDYRSYKDTAELWKIRVDRMAEENGMILAQRKSGKEKGYWFLDFNLRDTSSMRIIKGRIISKNASLFTFYTIDDTLHTSDGLYQTLISSFETTEPFPGEDILKPRSYKLFDALKSKDSLKINEAIKNLPTIQFTDQDAPELLKLIENDGSYKKFLEGGSIGARNLFIEKVAELKNKSIIPALEKLYQKAGDSSLVQLKLLKALAAQKTKESYQSVLKLMEQETPIADEDLIAELFVSLRDSLQLSAQIAPGLIPYARYPEYKDEIYDLLAELIDSGYVKQEQYIKFKQEILLDAQAEIKRVLAAEEQKKNDKLELAEEDDDSDYSSYSSSYSSTHSSYATLNYACILLPFYKEPAVNKYFQRAYRSENTYISLKIDLMKIKRNISVPDSNIQKYIKSDFDRQELYVQLKKINRLHLFDSAYLNQEMVSRAIIYEDYTDENNDSIAFVEKRQAVVRGKIGYIYFFKRYNIPQESWFVDYVGIQPLDTNKVEVSSVLKKTGTRFGKDSELKALVKDAMDDVRIYGRKRARRYNGYRF